jgi:hypothetical protein
MFIEFLVQNGPLIISLITAMVAIVAIISQTEQQKTNLLFDIYKEERGIRIHISEAIKENKLSDLDVETFYNHFEILSYLVNNKKIKEKDVRSIFLPGIEMIYSQLVEKEKIKGEKYKEISGFIERIRGK